MDDVKHTNWADSAIPRHNDGRFKEYQAGVPEATLADTSEPAESQGVFARTVDAISTYRNRCRELLASGFMPAASMRAVNDPRYRDGIDAFWETHYAEQEQTSGTALGSYEVMPDDYTPGMSGGHALSGHRRTHRIAYSGAETTVRMPSATSIRRFANEKNGRTFDVPVEATYPGGSVSGFVRVTPNGPGQWAVSGVNMPPEANSYISESVQAVLEARNVSTALSRVPDLLERRAERLRAAGSKQIPVTTSDWVQGAGYNPVSGDLTLNLNGRMYGYRDVPRDVYQDLIKPGGEYGYSTGKAYNMLVRKKFDHFQVESCPKCRRVFEQGRPHRCASEHRDRQTGTPEYTNRVRAHLLRRVARAGA